MTLREELAARLQDVANQWEIVTSDKTASEVQQDRRLAVADECIRQMEWAQDQGWKHYDINREPMYQAPPVTLAPEGWRPSASGGEDWKP